MPDHEEAVRKAWIAYANHQPSFMYDSPERAIYMAGADAGIKAERTKYAALVEAAVEVVRIATPEHFETNRSVSALHRALHRALTALQKEALNELQA